MDDAGTTPRNKWAQPLQQQGHRQGHNNARARRIIASRRVRKGPKTNDDHIMASATFPPTCCALLGVAEKVHLLVWEAVT